MGLFRDSFEKGEFLITAECGPPKGTDVAPLLAHARRLVGLVHAVNVTDNQAAMMRASSLSVCKLLLDIGLDPIFQITCRDRNRLAIQSDLLGAHILGIRNVLCLTGDHVTSGDHKEAKAVFDMESVQLLQVVGLLNRGKDMAGNQLEGASDLFPGATVVPEANPIEPTLFKFEKKVKAGARFIQTQAVYDTKRFMDFMARVNEHKTKDGIKILAGILLLKSAGMANYVNKNVPGIKVPEEMISRLKSAGKEKSLDAGIDIAAETIKGVKDYCDGVHIMAIGAEEHVPEILKRAGL
ncbi:MAG TPA: methylenetetrahydrofolate reductase [Nitrospiria bacterium]|nr:methylenetetrahydrofolate reductase [Nitrospiria bacterium]